MEEQLHPKPNPFSYWIPPPPPPNATEIAKKKPPAPSKAIPAPEFYEPDDDVPPAPPGLIWYKYKTDVPPLPPVSSKLGPAFQGYIWMYDPSSQIQAYTFTTFDKLTLSNVHPGDNKLWVHAVVACLISLYFFYLLYKYSKEAVQLRLRYLSGLTSGIQPRTILTTDVPGLPGGTVADRLGSTINFLPEGIRKGIKSGVAETVALGSKTVDATAGSLQRAVLAAEGADKLGPIQMDAWGRAEKVLKAGGSGKEVVQTEFEELYPGQLDFVTPVYNTDKVDGTYAKYNAIHGALTDLLDDYESKANRGKPLKRRMSSIIPMRYGGWVTAKYGSGVTPIKVDSMEFMLGQLGELRDSILKQQQEAQAKSDPAAFVTFKSRRAQMVATTVLQDHDTSVWHNESAPGPDEVYWPNLRIRGWERTVRFWLVWAAFIAMALLFMIPVGAVQALLTISNLSKIPGINQAMSLPVVPSVISGILPTLALTIFLLLVPPILYLMAKVEGLKSTGEMDRSVMSRFFIFQIITVFLGSFIGGTMLNQLQQWMHNPDAALTILGTAAPLTAVFFTQYIMIQAFWATPYGNLRLVPFIIFWLKSRFLASTERSKRRLWSESFMMYGTEVPTTTMVVLLGLAFACIMPIIAPISVCYFILAGMTAKYNLMYVQREAYQTGGQMWRQIFDQLVTCLFIFQLLLTALLGIKKSKAAILVAVLLPLTLIVRSNILRVFERPLQVVSLRAAVDLDTAAPAPALVSEEEQKEYMAPALKFNEADYESLKQEVAEMDRRLEGGQVPPKASEI
eukprot:jgi/Botrbrau1/5750/Bobra.0134s0023.2